jgi:hypothetical protein
MRFLATALALGLTSAALFGALARPTQRLELDTGCKPSAPLELELLSSAVVNGVAELDYTVRPLIEGRELSVRIETDERSELLLHHVADTPVFERGELRQGSARVQLPADLAEHGVTLELVATMTFDGAGDDGTTSIERQSVVRLLHLGAASQADNAVLVTSGDEVSLDMPAARTEER